MRTVQALTQDAGLGKNPAGQMSAEPADRLEADTKEAIITGTGQCLRTSVRRSWRPAQTLPPL